MTRSSSRSTSRLLGAALLYAVGLLAGCASTAPTVSDDDSSLDAAPGAKALSNLPATALYERSLAVRTGSTPSFYADTPGRRTYGILGVIAMMREGNRLVEDFRLDDPAGELSEELVAALADQNRMRTSTRDSADLLLDVKTINWDFRPYRNDPENLYVVYSARVSLLDRHSGAVLASGKCRSQRDREGDSATLEELLADGARRLHDELREAAHECARRLKRESFAMFLQNVAPVARQ